ncbi:MAG TPA: gliding motility-associated C-terminal domain-containing protein [Ferruginibacter sp.]|nr:gliding motility-associated C-terminal domain-containing protein [Ferruginibacter sp.]HRO05345.1 gliding motility-associated C-terminal domain-containing protein [Ferruginibacter sp.]HRO96417.1 gliding motility-associated C-terminal domain-containing protein [Ferruginibacter sp.]HRP48557.1 gliding motility-associated C-terminal domain-containing protein [Ferruginibacter sp.]
MLHRLFSLIFVWVLLQKNAGAQCTTFINTYPYIQDFEADNGGWQSGGNASSWTWGTPNKSIITGAGGGNRSWITGGLTSNAYNDGEDSWLRSPCFNFTTLSNPQISFKVFWETERNFDGAILEYSTNGGTSWTALGNDQSNANCAGENWHNNPSIRYLGFTSGWAGTIKPTAGPCLGGGGTGVWLTAKHTLSMLAGQPSVRFRFRFGAGTTCNIYDGFAFDDFKIQEVFANPSDFSWECTSSNTVAFNTTSRVCQTGLQWNFGDPASGAANTSTAENPAHTFSAPGTYTITLQTTFSNAPPSTTSKTIAVLSAVASVSQPIACAGGTGAVTVQVTGAGTPLQYEWTGFTPQGSPLLSFIPAGNYTVNVTAVNTCPITASVTLTEPGALSVANTISNTVCGAANGSITLNVTGGTAPYTYAWSNGATTANLNNITAGVYSVTVTDANGCNVSSGPLTVQDDAGNLQVSATVTDALCGAANGSITLNITGGTAPYTYAWSNGATTSALNNIAAGVYTVTVTDANGCSVSPAPITVQNDAGNLQVNATVTDALCGAANGSITLNITGGTAPFTYAWSNGATTSALNNIAAGVYNVTVTDANGCSTSPAPITVQNDAGNLQVGATVIDAVCTSTNGSISLTLTGGTAPYTYSWSNGATTATLNNLAAGAYSVTVTDANGCSVSANATVNVNQPVINPGTQVQAAGCNTGGGSIQLNPTGGTAPYQYVWSTGETTASITSLAAGTYSVQITDANGCVRDVNNIQVENVSANITVQPVVTPSTCETGGSISLNITGGTAPYTYSWSNGATTASVSNLATGNYSVTVTDINGCSASENNIEITRSSTALPVTLGSSKNVCPGETLTLFPGVYATYQWQDGSTGSTLTVNTPGIYTVAVTDNNGCAGSATVEVTGNCGGFLYFPSAFTPDGDGLNDTYGGIGQVGGLKYYSLTIYGRWGQQVFTTRRLNDKWDGRYKGKLLPTQALTWVAEYIIDNRPKQIEKGTLLLIR